MKKVIFSLLAVVMTAFSAMAIEPPSGYDNMYFNMGEAEYLSTQIGFDGGGSLQLDVYKNGISFSAQDMDFGKAATMTFGDVTLKTQKNQYGEVIFEVKAPATLAKVLAAAATGKVNITLSNGKSTVWSGPVVANLKIAVNAVKRARDGMRM